MYELPEKFLLVLAKDRALEALVKGSISLLSPWIMDNKLEFFPEYSDHGPTHLRDVMLAAEGIISDSSWELMTPEDAAAICISVLLHDCAMHLTVDGFFELVNGCYKVGKSRYVSGELPWPDLWVEFMIEARRFDAKKLRSIFGDESPVRETPESALDICLRDRLLIGEFIRRNHARLAHEIALSGVPGPDLTNRIRLAAGSEELLDLCGFIARSHNLDLRRAVDCLEPQKRRIHLGVHVPFVMGVLRVADYMQIHSSRAPKSLLKAKRLLSPISRAEWKKHDAVIEVCRTHDDPEAIYIDVSPRDSAELDGLQRLFRGFQAELDSVWAVLGEFYGRVLRELSLNLRRVRTAIDDLDEFVRNKKPNFVPEFVTLKTADAEMLELLIAPLYGDDPSVGIREIVQNSVDACLELNDYLEKSKHRVDEEPLVKVSLVKMGDVHQVVVEDFGIGMSLHVIKDYFLNIGASFRNSDTWRKNHTTNGKSDVGRTGRFGIGVLASFLLGDEVHVITRHVSQAENDALEFDFGIDQGCINIRKTRFHVGTKITVRVDKETYEKLNESKIDWDWYCLKYPRVCREIVEEDSVLALDQRHVVPMAGSEDLLGKWNRIRASGFQDVFWTCEKHTSRRGFRSLLLVCNGILISDYYRVEKLSISLKSPAFSLNVPSLAVFDRDGIMPINLQRDGLTSKNLPFMPELCKSIADVVVRKLLNKFSSTEVQFSAVFLSRIINFEISELLEASAYEHKDMAAFLVFDDGLVPLDFSLVALKRPSSILVDAVNLGRGSGAWGSDSARRLGQGYLCVGGVTGTKQGRIAWIRSYFLQDARTWFNSLMPRCGARLLIRKLDLDELKGSGGVPKNPWRDMRVEWSNTKWVVYSFGKVEEISVGWEEISSELELQRSFAIAINYYDWTDPDFKVPDESLFASAWLSAVGGPSLPFSKR